MRLRILNALVAIAIGWVAGVGCKDAAKSADSQSAAPAVSSPEAGAPSPAQPSSAAPAAATPAAGATGTVAHAPEAAAAKVTEATRQLAATPAVKGDATLNGLVQDLSGKAAALAQSFQSDGALTGYLDSALQALKNNQDMQSLEIYRKIASAQLTPEQSVLVNEVRNLVSAFTVQKNFASLSSSEGEVVKIVNALRSADTATALTHLKELASAASLSPEQSQLLNSLMGQYAPGVNAAGDAVKDQLKGLNPF